MRAAQKYIPSVLTDTEEGLLGAQILKQGLKDPQGLSTGSSGPFKKDR